jgi:hypothetical protein
MPQILKINILFISLRYFLYRKVDYFSAHGIGGQSRQGGCGKYTLRYFGEEDFTAASVSGP